MHLSDQHKSRTAVVLGSSSRYRKALLDRLGFPFEQISPSVDENALDGELPEDYVTRICLAKGAAVAQLRPDAVVIASDQCATFADHIIGKAHKPERAIAQLMSFSGKDVRFLTSVCVYADNACIGEHTDVTLVRFRTLSKSEVTRYVEQEQPWDCAGSFKCEGLGITLFDQISSKDPTALIGLPLIQTAALLRKSGMRLP